jgi:hypothetical protein
MPLNPARTQIKLVQTFIQSFPPTLFRCVSNLCQLACDRRAPALTRFAGNGVSSRRLRLLIACLGMVEERATEWGVVDADGRLGLLRGQQEGVPLVVVGGGGCGSHFGLLCGGVWVEDGFLVARRHTRMCFGWWW